LSWPNAPLGGRARRIVDAEARAGGGAIAVGSAAMNDDGPSADLETLRAEHRQLDERIAELSAEAGADQLELARLKKRKLRLKDQIQRIVDSNIPDIIA
jgi:hypothetical protein